MSHKCINAPTDEQAASGAKGLRTLGLNTKPSKEDPLWLTPLSLMITSFTESSRLSLFNDFSWAFGWSTALPAGDMLPTYVPLGTNDFVKVEMVPLQNSDKTGNCFHLTEQEDTTILYTLKQFFTRPLIITRPTLQGAKQMVPKYSR